MRFNSSIWPHSLHDPCEAAVDKAGTRGQAQRAFCLLSVMMSVTVISICLIPDAQRKNPDRPLSEKPIIQGVSEPRKKTTEWGKLLQRVCVCKTHNHHGVNGAAHHRVRPNKVSIYSALNILSGLTISCPHRCLHIPILETRTLELRVGASCLMSQRSSVEHLAKQPHNIHLSETICGVSAMCQALV